MKTDKVFNTPFETALRVALLLSVAPEDLDATSIQAIDFLATYGKAFSLSSHNANGDNRFMHCELAARKGLIDKGLRMLVKKGYVLPFASKEGFLYRLSSEGQAFACSINTKYAEEYSDTVTSAFDFVRKNGIESVFARVQNQRDSIEE